MDALHVAYDPEKLRQIVVNLLSNALKFTPEKGNIYITVSKNVLPHDEPNLTLIIKVKDTGIGIPGNQLQTIFDRFYQVDNSHTRAAEGTGIGLSLTKELVKLMQGEIVVKSPPAGATKGSEFTVLLPMINVPASAEPVMYPIISRPQPSQVAAPIINGADPTEEHKERPLILLVEDNADVVAYTASCLPDYRLAFGKDGREGFDIAIENIPDLIITDVMMPFVDGFELCHRLRADEHTSHIPIIMLTAKADMESRLEGLQKGADVYLQKPFHKEELLVRIKKLLELRKNLQQYYLRKACITNTITVDTIIEDAIAVNRVEDAFVKKVREAVEANLTDAEFTVEKLCKSVFMSHSQLHRKLEALTSLSPNKFIRMIRFQKAQELLIDQSRNIASIAYDCGFTDPGYFARVFKQEYGVTPQEWRVSKRPVL
jgi:DNA-binding response OmpR family regulator